jgi:hypothetical protein
MYVGWAVAVMLIRVVEICTKHLNTLHGQDVEFLNVKSGGA